MLEQHFDHGAYGLPLVIAWDPEVTAVLQRSGCSPRSFTWMHPFYSSHTQFEAEEDDSATVNGITFTMDLVT